MRLLFIVRCDPFKSFSGTEIFAKNLALELANQGHQVVLVYESRNSYEVSIENVEAHGFHLIDIPYIRTLHYRNKRARVCINLIKKSSVDVIISFGAGTFAGHIFKKIKGLSKKPALVYYAIDSMVAEYERSRPLLLKGSISQKLKAWIWYKALIYSDKLSCNIADIIIASCKDTATRIVKDYHIKPQKVKVVYFGVPDNYAKNFEAYDSDIPFFLHISTVPKRKGTIYFLKALKILQDKYDLRVKGVIVGSKEKFYIDLANKLHINVVFLGKIPNNELKKYYASCIALVSPSLSEGFGLPVIEAAMFGKPAIVSNVGSLPELVTDGENGFVVPAGDIFALSERMYRIAVDEQLRKKLSEKSKIVSQRFKISSTAKTLVNVLSRIRETNF